MKMDNNIDTNGGDSPPPHNGTENTARQSVADALNDILEQFTSRLSNGVHGASNGHAESEARVPPPTSSAQLADILQQVTRTADGTVEGIDIASPLGQTLQRKFTELEEISHRLKTRLNQVVCDTDILLSPDNEQDQNITDLDLERDLNTDSQAEDLTPQEFYQLVQSQIPTSNNNDTSDKPEASK